MEIISNKNTDIEVSYFEKFNFVKNASFEKIIASIKNGIWENQIAALREGKAKGDKEWETIKKQLPAFTPSATFDSKRTPEFLLNYNQLVGIDIDKISADNLEITTLIEKVNADNHTYASFISPSGDGIKLFVKVNSVSEHHKDACLKLIRYYRELLDIDFKRFDPKCVDLNRLCYVSYDPNASLNKLAITFDVNIALRTNAERIEKLKKAYASKMKFSVNSSQFQKAVELTLLREKFEEGNRNNFVNLLANNCNRFGIEREDALKFILSSQYNYDDNEVTNTVLSAYKNGQEHNKYPLRNTKANRATAVIEENEIEKMNSMPDGQLATSPEIKSTTPFIPAFVYDHLPKLLKEAVKPFDDPRKRDVFLTAALGVLSGCFPNFSGEYDKKNVNPNLYTFVSAPAGSGKGVMNFAKYLADDLHTFFTEKAVNLGEAPSLFFIPGNSSDAVVIGHLNSTGGIGVILETEADTLSANFGKEWGDFSVLLRYAFHHETYQYSRKGNNFEYIILKRPRISVVLSGTPGQIGNLTKSTEDGLFSRFMFYSYDADPVWNDPSPKKGEPKLDEYFTELGREYYKIIETFYEKKISFELTDEQWLRFNFVKGKALKDAFLKYGNGIRGIINRGGIKWYRIAMILSAVSFDGVLDEQTPLICTDINFAIAEKLMEVYQHHTLQVYSSLPAPQINQHETNLHNFFLALPKGEFKKEVAVEIGKQFGMNPNVVGKALRKLMDTAKIKDSKDYAYYVK